VVNVSGSNTVSGTPYFASFTLTAAVTDHSILTNLYLPQINVIDASLNGYAGGTWYYGTVTATPAYVPPIDVWRRSWFTGSQLADPAVSGDFANPAHDGIVNLLKYALGLNPTNITVNALPTTAVSSNKYLTLTYRQNKQATDISYAVEACGSLIPNSWSTNGLMVISQADSNTYWSVTVRDSVPMTNAVSRFMRLKVTKP